MYATSSTFKSKCIQKGAGSGGGGGGGREFDFSSPVTLNRVRVIGTNTNLKPEKSYNAGGA